MKLSSEILKYWEGVKGEFSKKLGEQIASEIVQIKNSDDYRLIFRTIKAKVKTEAQKVAVRIFNRLVKAIFNKL